MEIEEYGLYEGLQDLEREMMQTESGEKLDVTTKGGWNNSLNESINDLNVEEKEIKGSTKFWLVMYWIATFCAVKYLVVPHWDYQNEQGGFVVRGVFSVYCFATTIVGFGVYFGEGYPRVLKLLFPQSALFFFVENFNKFLNKTLKS